MKIKGAEDFTLDQMIIGLGGDRDSVDELTNDDASDEAVEVEGNDKLRLRKPFTCRNISPV